MGPILGFKKINHINIYVLGDISSRGAPPFFFKLSHEETKQSGIHMYTCRPLMGGSPVVILFRIVLYILHSYRVRLQSCILVAYSIIYLFNKNVISLGLASH